MATIIERRGVSDDAAAYGILVGVLIVAIMLVLFLLFGVPWSTVPTATEIVVPTSPAPPTPVYITPPPPPDVNITIPERSVVTPTPAEPSTPEGNY